MKIRSIIKVVVIFGLVVFIFWPTFNWMRARYTEADNYYSHGFLVPIVSLFLICRRWKEFKPDSDSNIFGLFLAGLGLLIHLIALRWGVNFISGFALIMFLFGLFLSLWGNEATRKSAFALFFLFFMIPLPKVMIISASFRLKIISAQLAAAIVNAFGISAFRMGSIVKLPNTSLTIGEPCSGLRSLISLLALGTLYAYLSDLSRIRKFFLFLSTIPIAIVVNVIRIVMLLLVAYVYGAETAIGKFHDFSGFLLFAMALLALMTTGRILSWSKKS